MTCFFPLQGYRGADGGFVPSKNKSRSQIPLTVPCGGCIGCRMAKAKDWSIRIAHEAQMHEENSFLTLTFRDADLPDDYSVRVRDIQLFMKRLRKEVEPTLIRFFACGEYGDKGQRPHYHVIIFGYGFSDRVPCGKSPTGYLRYRSPLLEKVWPYGTSEIGTVTPESGGYVARYVIKKIGGPKAGAHYQRLHPLTGEIVDVAPEFATMSRMPGIGSTWLDKYEGDVFPGDYVVLDGKRSPVPKFYDRRLKERETDSTRLVPTNAFAPFKAKRKERANKPEIKANSTSERLETRAECARLKAERLKRELETDE